MKTICISAPFFPGFYETHLETSDTAYYAITEEMEYLNETYGKELTADDFNFDYKSRRDDIITEFISTFKDFTPNCVENVSLNSLSSPTYYNFRNDELYINVDLTDDWVETFKDFINKNRETLEKRIATDWTSRDGFISFIENSLADFEEKLFNDEYKDQDVYIGIMLGYIMSVTYNEQNPHSEGIYYSIIYNVLENISDSDYISVVENK